MIGTNGICSTNSLIVSSFGSSEMPTPTMIKRQIHYQLNKVIRIFDSTPSHNNKIERSGIYNVFNFSKIRMASITVLLIASLTGVPFFIMNNNHNAYAMGDNPSSCVNRYDATITSMIIDNGRRTVTVLDSGGNGNVHHHDKFVSHIDVGYTVTFTLHTSSQSSQGNTDTGSTWFRHTGYGFAEGRCVDGVGPNQDIPITIGNVIMPTATQGTIQLVEWGSLPEISQVHYSVAWHK